jgi:uncharacterized protein YqeY
MELRARISEDIKLATKARESLRLSALRLINAAIKDREIALRGEDDERALADSDITAILSRMVKQRQDSIRAYEEAGRLELVAREQAEIEVIGEYLPQPLTEDETWAAIDAEIAELPAPSLRDMGPVMAALKQKFTGQLDFARVGAMVKQRLSAPK